MRAPEFWDAPPGLAAGLLAPVGAAWSAAAALRRAVARPYRAPVLVVCIGNLVAGGSGKTPIVLSLAGRLAARGVKAHIVTRGYGGRLAGPVRVDPRNHSAAEVGDEALLLAAAICWVARDRPSGLRAAADAGAQVILLDDGFQNPDFDKDLSLLAIDAEYGFGNGRVMPAGPLREPVEVGLARADAVVLVGSGNPIPPGIERSRLPILRAELVPIEGAWFRGRRIVAFAGIGRPAKFFATLQALGSEIVAARSFADHHRFSTAEIAGLRREAEAAGASLVTTAKDWVRIPSDERHGIEVLAVALHWRDPAALDSLLASILNHDRSPCAARGG